MTPVFNRSLLLILAAFFPVIFGLWSVESSAEVLEKVRLQLQWKHQFEFAGFYAAKEKGYYAEAGLDVEFIEFDSDIDTVERLLNGDVQFAVGYSSIIADYLQGKPLVLLANFLKRSPIAIVAQPDLLTPQDLAGKSLMGFADNMDNITLLMMLKRFEVDLDSVVNVPPSYSVSEFVDGRVDAMVVFTTNEVFDIQAAGKKYTLFDPTVFGAEYYDVNLFTSRSELETHPIRVKQFRQASIKGWQYALRNQSEIIELIQKRYNSQNKTRESLEFEAGQIWNAMMPKVHPIGSVEEQRIRMIASDFIEMGLLPEETPLNLNQFVYREPSTDLMLTEEEQGYLNNREAVSFCADPNWMPLEKVDNGSHLGMSADYFDLFATKLNTSFRLVPTGSWEQSLRFAKERKCDLLSLAMATPDRRVFMNFTSPYLRSPLVIATSTDTLFINEINEVLDRPLGIVKGYAFSEILRNKHPNINLRETDSLRDGLQQVAAGELFGFIGSMATIGHILQKEYIGELKIAGKFQEHWALGIGVRNDDPILHSILEKTVNNLTPEEHQKISNTWISVTFEEGVDYVFTLKILGVALGIFLLLAYHLIVQSRYVERLQAANHEIKEKNQLLEVLSTTDPLTGLYNRAKLDEVLRRELAVFERYQTVFSVVLIDIDHFKRVNDQHGHIEGDRLLNEVARLLLDNIRKIDVLGRWGGEEFLVLCPNTDLESALAMAENLRSYVESGEFKLNTRITISLGVAQAGDNLDMEALLRKADSALYKAKAQGRNCVSSAV